ncbi:type IV pilus modification protein PilV [Rhodoferax sp. GW822-FHT02A01]|uniref:type IV pilus modification protein PilV n=1 Tax=Rhodoferax sp. GW822-FHT02A01 TaxID=3141537 RepID=UPI00315D6BE8
MRQFDGHAIRKYFRLLKMQKNSIDIRHFTNENGFSLIEVLVTILILAFGILGMAGMQLKAQTQESESYQRAQALVLLQDMTARINSNRANAGSYVSNTVYGTGNSTACSSSTMTAAQKDLCDWNNELLGASEQSSSTVANYCTNTSAANCIGAMVGARGCIEQVSAGTVSTPAQYRVSVAWQGLTATFAPPTLTCGINQYGAEAQRRVIDSLVTIACLTC